jgi:ArsR family metal-binding transcriptional regulator
MVDLVNETWEQRGQIQPSLVKREPLRALDVYKLLPGSNCKACGQPTCFTFALKLAAGQADIASCAPLFEEAYREKREQLLQMLESAGMTT